MFVSKCCPYPISSWLYVIYYRRSSCSVPFFFFSAADCKSLPDFNSSVCQYAVECSFLENFVYRFVMWRRTADCDRLIDQLAVSVLHACCCHPLECR